MSQQSLLPPRHQARSSSLSKSRSKERRTAIPSSAKKAPSGCFLTYRCKSRRALPHNRASSLSTSKVICSWTKFWNQWSASGWARKMFSRGSLSSPRRKSPCQLSISAVRASTPTYEPSSTSKICPTKTWSNIFGQSHQRIILCMPRLRSTVWLRNLKNRSSTDHALVGQVLRTQTVKRISHRTKKPNHLRLSDQGSTQLTSGRTLPRRNSTINSVPLLPGAGENYQKSFWRSLRKPKERWSEIWPKRQRAKSKRLRPRIGWWT